MAIPTKLEPLDPSDKSTYEDIKTKITEQALLVLTKTIPDRITTINALYVCYQNSFELSFGSLSLETPEHYFPLET